MESQERNKEILTKKKRKKEKERGPYWKSRTEKYNESESVSQPARHLCPWDIPDKSIGVGCHFLLQGPS